MSDLSFLEGRFLPHRVVQGWLGEDQADALLSYAVAERERFKPSKVAEGLDPDIRRSLVLRNLGPFEGLLSEKALSLQAELATAFGMGREPATSTEIEIVAHGDGCFYRPHIDTFTGDDHVTGEARRLTLIYYLHSRPRRFTGGRLRLYDMAAKSSVAIDPVHDSVLAFPSFAQHEVETVSCPDADFADNRFAVNIWLRG